MECIAFKYIVIMSHILRQKPFAKSKVKDYAYHLGRRLELWRAGEISELLSEATLQSTRWLSTWHGESVSSFHHAHAPGQGHAHAAMRLITEKGKGGILPLTNETYSKRRSQQLSLLSRPL